jgi:hypothetical protein
MSKTLSPLGVSPELVEQRIHEVAALNRLSHSLGEFGTALSPAPAEKAVKAPAPQPSRP